MTTCASPSRASVRAEKQLSDPSQRIHKVLETARVLYGLIHARYILTAQGLSDMVRRAHTPRARSAPARRPPRSALPPRRVGAPPGTRAPARAARAATGPARE